MHEPASRKGSPEGERPFARPVSHGPPVRDTPKSDSALSLRRRKGFPSRDALICRSKILACFSLTAARSPGTSSSRGAGTLVGMETGTDLRQRIAVDAGLEWYVEMCSAHGVRSRIVDGVWRAQDPMPPLHSAALVVEPMAGVEDVEAALAEAPHRSVADCFGDLDLAQLGLTPLFEATWLHLPELRTGSAPEGWSRVDAPERLKRWNAAGDTSGVINDQLLERPTFAVLEAEPARMPLGCVATLGTGAVYLSNVRVDPSAHPAAAVRHWEEVVAAVVATFPGRPIVGYESGANSEAALAVGFHSVGTTRIWVG